MVVIKVLKRLGGFYVDFVWEIERFKNEIFDSVEREKFFKLENLFFVYKILIVNGWGEVINIIVYIVFYLSEVFVDGINLEMVVIFGSIFIMGFFKSEEVSMDRECF